MTVLARPVPSASVTASPTPSFYPGGKIPADKFNSMSLLVGIVMACLVGLAIMSWLGKKD